MRCENKNLAFMLKQGIKFTLRAILNRDNLRLAEESGEKRNSDTRDGGRRRGR